MNQHIKQFFEWLVTRKKHARKSESVMLNSNFLRLKLTGKPKKRQAIIMHSKN